MPHDEIDRTMREAAFEAFLHSDMRPPGVDHLVLDIAFTAGWRGHKNRRSPPLYERRGREAFLAGEPIANCPRITSKLLMTQWRTGWLSEKTRQEGQ